jgi:DNA polymerase-1
MGQTLYVIDAHSLIFQVFHAIPEMSAPDGRPTNAVFGFSRDLLYLLEQKKPDFLICAFDTAGPTFRDEIYPEYKANRGPMPDNLRPQIDMIRQVIEAMGIPILELAGFEADDVIATIVREACERGTETLICTGDKDARQLIRPHVAIYNIRKDHVLDAAGLQSDWGVRPDQVVDLLAMTGDTVDNVPGIAGIGPKTASSLLQEFGTLDSLLANIDRVSGKKRQENLRAGVESARRARELVALRSDVPISIDWDAARTGQFDLARLGRLFSEFGFRRLAEQFRPPPPSAAWQGNYRTVRTHEDLATLVTEVSSSPRFAFALLTTEPSPLRSRLVGISICSKPGEAWYIPVRAPLGERLVAETDILAALRPLLESREKLKVAHDLKHHIVAMRRWGIQIAGMGLDTMVADYLMEAGERIHHVDQLASRYLQYKPVALNSLIGDGPRPLAIDLVPVADLTKYAGELADIVLRVSSVQAPKLKAEGLWQLYESVEGPLIEVLADMEFHGVRVDVELLARLGREFHARLDEITRQIYQLAGGEFNIASPIQLRDVLFQKLKLPVLRRTKTGPSADQEVLERLAATHPLPALLIEHRQISKLLGTYIEALPRLVNPDTGRIHATLHQVVAATGRLSSSDPNLQNIPIRTELGRQIRQAFVSRGDCGGGERGWQLLTADYSQIELRILAHFSGDSELCRAFAGDQDIHSFVASQIYGVAQPDVTSEMRRNAKTVNFGVIYGLSPFGLSARLGISQEEAEAFIDGYFAKYAGVDQFIRQVLERAHRDGFVTTILERRRRIAGVRPKVGRWLNQSEREAVNSVLQGSAADLIKVAMINLHRRIAREQIQSKMLLQIHDELLFEVPNDELAAMAVIVNDEMTGAMRLKVPLKVDVGVGPNWLDVEPVEPGRSQPPGEQ